jgi:hypothetical protein
MNNLLYAAGRYQTGAPCREGNVPWLLVMWVACHKEDGFLRKRWPSYSPKVISLQTPRLFTSIFNESHDRVWCTCFSTSDRSDLIIFQSELWHVSSRRNGQPRMFFTSYITYLDFQSENSLHNTALRTHEQNKFKLHCVSHVCLTADETGLSDYGEAIYPSRRRQDRQGDSHAAAIHIDMQCRKFVDKLQTVCNKHFARCRAHLESLWK